MQMSVTTPNHIHIGNFLLEMPFLDRLELSHVMCKPNQRVYEDVSELHEMGLVDSVPHATHHLHSTRRFYLTPNGLGWLARHRGVHLEDLLRAYPVSRHWQRNLLGRLDAAAAVYRVASTAALAGNSPVSMEWHRSHALDATLFLTGQQTVGILRQGATTDRTGFSKRVWRLQEGPLSGPVLVLAPDPVRLRHTSTIMSRVSDLAFVALEEQAVRATPQGKVWHWSRESSPVSLGTALWYAARHALTPSDTPLAGLDMPRGISLPESGLDVPDHLLPALLKPSEKQTMDVLADWPWVTPKELTGILGVTKARVSQVLGRLVEGGLVSRVPMGRRGHLALSDAGLTVLARRDRTSVGRMRHQWSPKSKTGKAPASWRDMSGRRSRLLARNMEHTEAVHWFLGEFARQARSDGYRIIQFDPPHRASRHFRHRGEQRSIHPDAFGMVRRGRERLAFFLEWERRAVRPSTMAARLAPYLRYYSSNRPTHDHGIQPKVLIVFDDPLVEARFHSVARSEIARTGVQLPLWVSHTEALNQVGPLGPAWRNPDVLVPALAFG